MEIIFTDTVGVDEQYYPVPASSLLPEWYKKSDSYINNEKKPLGDGTTSATIKRCMPVFDVLTSGYFLLTSTDIWVSKRNDVNGIPIDWYEWRSGDPISFHDSRQSALHPDVVNSSIPKWANPWSIKTPKDYSILLVPPVHRKNIVTALPAVVDTDTYTNNINIVFTLTDPNFEGLIPAGTPIVQIIPFLRNSWKMKIGSEFELKEQKKSQTKLLSKMFDSYKLQFRQLKEYK
jgi:hypothetical protein